MTNLDEKKLDDLAHELFPKPSAIENNSLMTSPNRVAIEKRQAYKIGYRQAFADQQKKIEKLEKAVELMRSGLKEISMYGLKEPNTQAKIAHDTITAVDSILTEKPSEA